MNRRLLLPFLLLAASLGAARAQVPDSLAVPDTLAPPIPPDTTAAIGFPRTSPAPAAGDGDGLEHPVTFTARDSLVIDFGADGEISTLFGEAKAGYENAALDAAVIDLYFSIEEMRARGIEADTGFVGRPRFSQGDESFTGRELAYNLRTGRGRIVGARTVVEDGYLLGGVVKQARPNLLYAADAVYTTCAYEDHPHYGLRAHEMKIEDDWVYTGPAQLYLLGIPTPLWLPFGFFPAAEGRRSGPLAPTYGEDPSLGFYLRDVGWYWAISDYLDLQVRGGIYSRGSFEVNPLFRYARRYHYSGNLNLAYARLRRGERQDPGFAVERAISLRWAHEQTLSPTARLSGDVNLSSRGYLRAISDDFDDRVTQTTQSRVSFQKNWARSGRSLALDLRQSQNLTTGQADLTLPSLRFTQRERFPFRGPRTGRGERWFEKIGYSYSGTLTNSYRFVRDTSRAGAEDVSWIEGLFSYDDYFTATGNPERFQFQASHTVPVSASFTFTRLPGGRPMRLTLTPRVNYREDWYTRRRRVITDDEGRAVLDEFGRVQEEREQAFTAIRQFDAGVSASTEFFGTFPVRIGALDGFRHVGRPTLSLTFSPDYTSDFFGYFRTYRDASGNEVEYPIISGIPTREQARLAFRLSNAFLTRIARTDTTGEVQRRALKLLDLDLDTGYDFAADSLGFGRVNLNARTQIGNQLNLRLSARYSPYAVDRETGREIDRYYVAERGRLLRFLGLDASATTSLRGGRTGGVQLAAPPRARRYVPDIDDPQGGGLYPYDLGGSDLGVTDFAIPWQLSLDLNYRLTRNFGPGQDDLRALTLGTSFDLGLTPNWRVRGRSGYDFEQGEITTTQLSILRDLHCWEMAFSWIPFGAYRSFGFSIYVKSGYLRDLLRLDVPKQEVRDRFGLAGGGF